MKMGLPSNGIRGIEYDKSTGFLWVGTESGLVRFDGLYLKSYSHTNDSINISRVFALSRTQEGHIYLEDDKNSTYYIEGERPALVLFSPPEQADFMMYYDRDKSGSEVVNAIERRKIAAILPGNNVFDNNKVYGKGQEQGSAVFDNDKEDGNFLMLYRDSLFYIDIKKDTTTFLCTTKKKSGIIKIRNSIYVRNDNGGFLKYDPATQKLAEVPFAGFPKANNGNNNHEPTLYWSPGMEVPLFIQQKDLWKLTEDSDKGITSKIVCKDCMPEDNSINYIRVYDDLHYIFIGTAVNGLYILKQNSFYPGGIPAKNESETIPQYAQAELYPGYIQGRNGNAFSLQLKKLPNTSGIDFLFNLYKSSRGDFWYSKRNIGDTLFQYKPISHTVIPRFINSMGKLIFAETNGKLFLIGDYGIANLEGDSVHTLFQLPHTDSLPGKFSGVFTALEWEPGKIGIAAQRLVVYDVSKNLLDTLKLPHTSGEVVRALWKYGDYIFIGTYGQGFFIYKKGIIKKMPLDRAGYLSFSHCFMKDDKGFCWISTNHGLFKVSLSALIYAFEHNEKEVYYYYFGRSDGMINTELNGGCQPCALALSDGSFSFPTMSGFLKFYPDSVFAQPPSGKIYIDEIIADSLSLKPDNSLLNKLPYTMNKLSFKISVPVWSNPENLYVSYQLTPRINEWQSIDIANSNTLSFAALPSGNYTLTLRVRNGFNNNDFKKSVVHFTVLTPWYNSVLFYFFCLLGFLILTASVLKWRTAGLAQRKRELQVMVDKQVQELWWQNKQLQISFYQLNKQQKKLRSNDQINSRLISIISHDMLSPLKFIEFIAQKLRDNGSVSVSNFRDADSIVTVSRELELLSGKILDWIRFHYHSDEMLPRRFKLYELIQETIQIPFTLAKEKNVSIYNSIDQNVEIFQYREAIGEIINNLVMNAAKNTEKGEIRITYEISDSFSLLVVSDTGTGISQELLEKLNNQEQMISEYASGYGKKYRFGFVIIKELLQLINGNIKIESKLGEGTQVFIKFREAMSKI